VTATDPSEDPIAGRVALVTGASSGIGAATAVALAAEGARAVAICARRKDRLDEVLEHVRAHAPDSRAFVVDLADLDGLPGFAREVESELGRVDLLVNNVGVAKRRRMQAITRREFEDVMRVNFLSAVTLTTALLPGMLDRADGRIVNVSSMGTRTAAVRVGAYAASKAALELWTEGLLLDLLGTGVTAQLFVPGTTRTEFSLPREDQDEPFPPDPNAMEPAAVAEALVALVRSDAFEGFASDAGAELSKAKRSDPNAFLDMVKGALRPEPSARGGPERSARGGPERSARGGPEPSARGG
jgi:short-subunit dehydrogenase